MDEIPPDTSAWRVDGAAVRRRAEDAAETARRLPGTTELNSSLFRGESPREVLAHILAVALHVFEDAEFASVTATSGPEGYATPAATDSFARLIDQAQYEHGEGPCLDVATAGGAVVRSDDLTDRSGAVPWPEFARVATAMGVRSVLAVGLFPGDDERSGEPCLRFGALNLYSRRPGAFTAVSEATGVLLGAHASTALTAATALGARRERITNLERALETRDVIGQAKGILMERYGLSADQAFDRLRKASQDVNIKLRDVADYVTTERTPRLG